MKFRDLGASDLKVSTLCLGSWVFGGECWGDVSDSDSRKVVERAIDSGVNFIDTAPVYGNGRSEKVIGAAMKGKRDKLIIATKCGLERKGHQIRPNLKADFLREEVENSLRRLGVDVIDLYQCHWPDPNASIKETFGELKRFQEEGKIKHIGVSNFSKELLSKVMELAPVVSNQVQYSLLDREIEEELIPFCKENKVSILAYGPLGGGILTGKYKDPPKLERGDVKSFFYKFYTDPLWSKANSLVDVLREIASERDEPVSDVAINWVLSNSAVASCIAGCRTSQQLDQNIRSANWDLSDKELELIQTEYKKVFY